MKQLISILVLTAIFSGLGIWWLRFSQASSSGQFPLEANQVLREIEVRGIPSGLVVGAVEIRSTDALSVFTMRAGLPSPASGTVYKVLGVSADTQQVLGSMNLGNGSQYFLIYQQPSPFQFDELQIQLQSLEDSAVSPLTVAKAMF